MEYLFKVFQVVLMTFEIVVAKWLIPLNIFINLCQQKKWRDTLKKDLPVLYKITRKTFSWETCVINMLLVIVITCEPIFVCLLGNNYIWRTKFYNGKLLNKNTTVKFIRIMAKR